MVFHRVVVGGLTPELVDELAREVRESLRAVSSTLWVVTPSTSLRLFLRTALADRWGDACLGGLRFLTQSLLIREFTAPLSLSYQIPPEPVRAALMQQVLDRLAREGKLTVFKSLRLYRHGPLAMVKTLQELKQATLTPADLISLAQEMLDETESTADARRLEEMVYIWEAYDRAARAFNWIDPPDIQRHLIESMDEGLFPLDPADRPRRIIFFGYAFMTGLNYEFMRILGRYLPVDVYFISRVWKRGKETRWHPAFAYLKDLFLSSFPGYLRIPEDGGKTADVVYLEPRANRPLASVFLSLFDPANSHSHPSFPPEENGKPRVVFHEVTGSRQEIEEAVRLCATYIARGVPPHRIAVVARTLDERLPIFLDLFDHYRVPVNVTREFPARLHPVGQWLQRLVAGFHQAWPAEAVFQLMMHPMFNPEPFGLMHEDKAWLAVLRDLVHPFGLPYGENLPAFWDFIESLQDIRNEDAGLQWGGRPVSPVLLQRIRRGTDAFLQMVARVRDASSGPEAIKAWRLFIRAVTDMHAIERQRWPGPPDIALEYARGILQVHERDLDLLETMVTRSPVFSIESFFITLQELIEHMRIPSAPARYGGVWLLDAMAARGLTVDILLLVGMNDQIFPRIVDEDPFLPDDIRKKIRRIMPWVTVRSELYDEERALFYLLVSGVGEALHCFYQGVNDKGQPMLSSPFLDEIERSLRERGAGDVLRRVRVPRTKYALTSLMDDAAGDTNFLEDVIHPLHLWGRIEKGGEDFRRVMRLLWGTPLILTPAENGELYRLSPPAGEVLMAYLSERGLSPSWITHFRRCPFMALARGTLNLVEPSMDEGLPRLTDRELGIFVHRILHRLVKRFRVKGVYPRSDGATCELNEIFENELDTIMQKDSLVFQRLFPAVWDFAWDRIKETLQAYFESDVQEARGSGRQPYEMEMPVTLEYEPGKPAGLRVRLKGFIDRVDRFPSGDAIVMDYKVKRKEPVFGTRIRPDHLLRGDYNTEPVAYRFQLSFYAWLWRDQQAQGGAPEVRLVWIPSRTSGRDWMRRLTALRIPAAEVPAWIQAVQQVVDGVLMTIQTEGFPVTPGKACRFCRYHLICRYQEAQSHP